MTFVITISSTLLLLSCQLTNILPNPSAPISLIRLLNPTPTSLPIPTLLVNALVTLIVFVDVAWLRLVGKYTHVYDCIARDPEADRVASDLTEGIGILLVAVGAHLVHCVLPVLVVVGGRVAALLGVGDVAAEETRWGHWCGVGCVHGADDLSAVFGEAHFVGSIAEACGDGEA